MIFSYTLPELILISRINFGRSKNFLLFIRITFREIIKYKLLYLKINSNQINFINTEPNALLVNGTVL